MYFVQHLVIRIFIFVTKESKPDVKQLVRSCYTFENMQRHIILVDFISTVHKQDIIRVYLKKIKRLLKRKKKMSKLLIAIKLIRYEPQIGCLKLLKKMLNKS